jgi:predicted PurR-regulated permease PerM
MVKREDDRNYYIHPEGGFAPRGEKHGRKKPWYNQRWLVSVMLLIGIIGVLFALSGLTQEVAGVNDSIQDQTAVLEEQTDALGGLNRTVQAATQAIEAGFDRLIDELHSLAERIGYSV